MAAHDGRNVRARIVCMFRAANIIQCAFIRDRQSTAVAPAFNLAPLKQLLQVISCTPLLWICIYLLVLHLDITGYAWFFPSHRTKIMNDLYETPTIMLLYSITCYGMFHYTDQSVGLDQVLIQLQEVVPHWRDLAEAVGMDTESLERIKKHVKHHTSPIGPHLTLPMKLENLHINTLIYCMHNCIKMEFIMIV